MHMACIVCMQLCVCWTGAYIIGGGGELAVRIATILENNGTVCSMLVEK